MGEVGCGKTVVALAAMLRAVENGAQAALMAPTETLAEQHHRTLDSLLGGHAAGGAAHRVDERRAAPRAARPARAGELQLVVGTHALIEEAVEFATWRWWWWTSSTASACASARRWTPRRPTGSPRTRCT